MSRCRKCIYYRPSLEFRHQGYCSLYRCAESHQKERERKDSYGSIKEEKEYS